MCFSFRTLAAVCTVAVSLNTGCAARDDISSADSTGSSPIISVEKEDAVGAGITPEVPQPQYFEPKTDADCTITFAEDSIGIRGDGASVEGNAAVITEGGVYRLSGECSDGRLMIRSDDEVSLILNGLDIRSEDGTAVENTGAGGLTLSLPEGKENRIGSGSSAGIYSSSDITINGSGRLAVESGESAVSSEGAIRLCGGEISISSSGDGIVSGSHIIAAGANTSINSGADGMRVTYTGADGSGYVSMTDGALDIISATDGIQAENAVFISGGSVSLSCGGGSSAVVYNDVGGRYLRGRHGGYSAGGETEFDFSELVSGDGSTVGSKKGIRSGGCIEISGGEVDISSADDSIYAKNDIRLTDGAVTLSSGDDGVHSDDGIVITGGALAVENSYNSIEGMMVEIRGGDVRLNSRRGGIVAAGGTQLASSSSADSTDRYVSISGGSVSVNSGGSGINSGGAATLSGGALTIYSSDDDIFGSVDHRDYFALSGGIFAAFGSDGATKAPNVLSRPCISILADIREGSVVEITDSAGKQLFSAIAPRAGSTVLFSSEDIVSGEEYFVYADSVLQKAIVAGEGVSGDGPSGRTTGIFDGFDINASDPNENIA